MTLPKKIFGLIGDPVSHSLSPLMHNAAFAHLKIDAEYKLFPLKEQELQGFLRGLGRLDICGLNVTVPYKEKVIPLLANISEEARLIGAVNTIKVSNDRLDGFNTDGLGFLRHLKQELDFDPRDKSIAVIGAGGASRAVCVYLSKEGAAKISIFDIDKPKAQGLARHLKENFPSTEVLTVDSAQGLGLSDCALLVNASPIGMKESDPSVIKDEDIGNDLLVYDLVYNPAETKLLKAAKEKGARSVNGLGMLLHQGAAAFEIWTQEKAPLDVMRKALMEGVGK
ncbi:shikimate dehydrogenase [Candidatus Omnitrophota bacterium]